MVAYTDGLTDLKNKSGVNFSQEMVKSFILEHKTLQANEMCDSIMNNILEFKGNEELPDDIAIMTFKFFES